MKKEVADNYKNNFGLIRFVAAIMVIIGHMYTLAGIEEVPKFLWSTVNFVGVEIFFCIGGYLITLSWLRQPDFKIYMLKRICRIFPPLIVCVLLTAIVVGPFITNLSVAEYYAHPMTWNYLKNCLLNINYALPRVFEHNPAGGAVNGSLWCLPIEFLMYLVMPVYLFGGRHIGKKFYYGLTAIMILLGSVIMTWMPDMHFYFYGMDLAQIIRIVPFYFVGSLIAVCRLEKYLNLQISVVAILFLSGLQGFPAPFWRIGEYVALPYIVLSLALEREPVYMGNIFPSIWKGKRKYWYIDISYGMFLTSFVIQQILVCLVISNGWRLHIWILCFVAIVISVFMAVLIERFIERPVGRFCRKIQNEFND